MATERFAAEFLLGCPVDIDTEKRRITGMKISANTKRVIARFVIFGLLGMLFEVVLGGFWKLFADGEPLLRGFSSMWMILDYGILGILTMPLARPMLRRKIPLVLRAFVYMICIYIIEFISGWV